MGICNISQSNDTSELKTSAKEYNSDYLPTNQIKSNVVPTKSFSINDINTVPYDNQLEYDKEVEIKIKSLLETKGYLSDEETMKAKTDEIILLIEDKEELDSYKKELNREYNSSNLKEFLYCKGVIQFYDGSFYNGSWNKEYKKQGIGSLLMIDGSKYVGQFVNDDIEGKGYYIDTSGRMYIGEFREGKANGQGKITIEKDPGYIYIGSFKNNLFDGYGEETLPNGNIYKGQFREGYKESSGILQFSEGSCYEGEFQKSAISGKGVFKWKDGRVYEGDFLDNKLHGKGKTTWVDGSYYDGEYKNDQFNGYGELVSSDGSIFKGNWQNNCIHGVGYFKDSSSEYKGIWRYNKNIKKF